MENSDQSSSEVQIPDHNNLAEAVAQGKDSQPTKKKVAAFKSRVFGLLKIYCQKSPTLEPLLGVITEEAFMKDPERLNELVLLVLSKQRLEESQILGLIKIYKALLLHKNQSKESQ